MAAHSLAPVFDGSFPHRWQAEILPARPLILPTRHFVYPRNAEEVERGALEVLIRPASPEQAVKDSSFVTGHDFTASGKIYSELREVSGHDFPASVNTHSEQQEVSGHDFSRAANAEAVKRALAPEERSAKDSQITEPFLATCALGFRDPVVPSGLWSTPNPDEICAVSGGYAYIICTTAPERFTMIAYRPVLQIRPLAAQGLLLFAGHHSILAWGANGHAWQSARLSSEGLTITRIEGDVLRGLGWDLITDREAAFKLDLKTGKRAGDK